MDGDPQGIPPYAVTKWAAQSNERSGHHRLPRRRARSARRHDRRAPTTTTMFDGMQLPGAQPGLRRRRASASFGRIFFNAVRNDAPAGAEGHLQRRRLPLHTTRTTFLIPFGNTPLGNDTSAITVLRTAQLTRRRLVRRGRLRRHLAPATPRFEARHVSTLRDPPGTDVRARGASSVLTVARRIGGRRGRPAAHAAGRGPATRTGRDDAGRSPCPRRAAGTGRNRHRQPDREAGQPDRPVSWTGFRPELAPAGSHNSGDSVDVNTEYPGARLPVPRRPTRPAPATATARPGSAASRRPGTTGRGPRSRPFTYPGQDDPFDATPDGPANWQDNVTRADGTGRGHDPALHQARVRRARLRRRRPCSIVVVPNYGRPQGATEDLLDAPWAWDRRTVVPLSFLPVDDACPLTGDSLRVEGSPMVADAARELAREDLHADSGRRARSTTPRSASRRPVATSPPARPTSACVIDPLDAGRRSGRAASSTHRSASPGWWSPSRSTTPTASR